MPSSCARSGFHQNGGGCAVGGLRGVAGGDRSLRVEGGLELGKGFGGGVGARAFVGGEDRFRDDRLAGLRAGNRGGDGHRDQLVGKASGGLRGQGLAVAGKREGVLIFARDL